MPHETEPPQSIDELVDRLLMVVVDLGWTPPGWRPNADGEPSSSRPHHAWLLERLGDLAYILAKHATERDQRAALAAGDEAPVDDATVLH